MLPGNYSNMQQLPSLELSPFVQEKVKRRHCNVGVVGKRTKLEK
jgi:hypothetical protein